MQTNMAFIDYWF